MKKILVWLMLFALLLGNMPDWAPAAHAESVAEEIAGRILQWALTLEEVQELHPGGETFSYEIDGIMKHMYFLRTGVSVGNFRCEMQYDFAEKGLYSIRCERREIPSLEEALAVYDTFENGLSTLYGIQLSYDPVWEVESKKSEYGSNVEKALADGVVSSLTGAYYADNGDWYFIWLLRHSATEYQVLFDVVPGEETLENAYQERLSEAAESDIDTMTVVAADEGYDSALLPAPWGSSIQTVNANLDFQGEQGTYQISDGERTEEYPVLNVSGVMINGIPFKARYSFSGEGLYSVSYASYAPGILEENENEFEMEDGFEVFYQLIDELTETMQAEPFYDYQWVDAAAEKQYAMRVDQAIQNGKLTGMTVYFDNAEQFVQLVMSAKRFDIVGMSLTVPDPLNAPLSGQNPGQSGSAQPAAEAALPQPTAAPVVSPQRVKPAGLSPFSFDWGSSVQTVKNGLNKYTETTANLYAGTICTPYPYLRSTLNIGDYKFQSAYSFSGEGLCWIELWLNSANKGSAYAAYSKVEEMFTAYLAGDGEMDTAYTWKSSKAESDYGDNIKQAWRDGKITDIVTSIYLDDSFYQILLNDFGITVYGQGLLIPSPAESAP